jgi:hypothetical protein
VPHTGTNSNHPRTTPVRAGRSSLERVAKRTYKLDHFTKGTGASVTPIEHEKPAKRDDELRTIPVPRARKPRGEPGPRLSTPLPPGHVRKKSTGEIGEVLALDPKAGTATVRWLRSGATSTVPLAAVTRR